MATTLKRIRLSLPELRAITDGLHLLAKGNAWGLSSDQVRKLASLIANADAVIVTPGSLQEF